MGLLKQFLIFYFTDRSLDDSFVTVDRLHSTVVQYFSPLFLGRVLSEKYRKRIYPISPAAISSKIHVV